MQKLPLIKLPSGGNGEHVPWREDEELFVLKQNPQVLSWTQAVQVLERTRKSLLIRSFATDYRYRVHIVSAQRTSGLCFVFLIR